MKRLLLNIVFLLLLSCLSAAALVRVELRNGQVIVGEIIVEQSDVVVLRQQSDGARFQFPRSEVKSITEVEETVETQMVKSASSSRRVSVQVSVMGGYAMLRQAAMGAGVDARLSIGACNLMQRGIFFGGTVGYRHLWLNAMESASLTTLQSSLSMSLLPLEATVKVPLTDRQHSPYLGLSAGYAIALSSSTAYRGGLLADIDLGWKWRLADSKAIMMFLNASFLQSRLMMTETITGVEYTGNIGHAVMQFSLGMAVEI